MITDARVLQPEFVPNDVKHRSAEVSHLSDTLRPIVDGERATNSLLYGPSGAGKTCIAQFTIEQLRENVVDLNYQYVNCWEDHTRFKTLYRLLDGIESTFDIHRQSTPKDELLERLRAYDGPPYVVILDEVDQLQDKSLLYDLYRMRDLTMILIANREEDVFSTLDGRLNSRLESCARIRFGQYDIRELVTILEDRARWGLEPGAVDEQHLETIADYAAGDARIAIGIFRNAARVARQNGDDGITVDVIERVVPETKSEIRQKTTDKLTEHQQVLYETIKKEGEIGAGDLYDAYCEAVDDPKTRRTMRNHLSKLEQYNLVFANGKTKARTYQPYS
ncbi:orc1/cdc6 family replication initiation protein [Halorubrum lacusprofundi ATCC 49239]|jgi:orc1/cdc6 family replication initiation protein|uniref:Orc1/cdc6 family replication initiation protein n=1 Tax=Halorubrum lacusprofundi (strain ATCC 49239 / DSM 5036 / JCM 8891 / ACAM 34) TaxID=416348 RepID=B9LVN7_HALLT|nr:Cdc6/Cdc18 family protein [Halorubrum lacusprofundi]ACM58750.1 orc1/cdc6 family replication initiation protein [Halorubrum lacusprofundi ATCC 49239]